ncbi:MAG: adenylate/guanylate cyclase domain-containing protein [Acidobacteria bacterium]|nr:MAG: adenylate/guanylate cyclase domain-containing protein [Acidobacteriota bacterium]
MQEKDSTIFRFGDFRLDAAERLVFEGDRSIQLPPKAFDTLLLLVKNAGRILSKERMLTEIWEGSFVEENNLAQNISLLRKTLGEDRAKKFIETVPKFGYRFITEVKADDAGVEVFERTRARVFIDGADGIHHISQDPASRTALPGRSPETRYVQNGDVNIAYQVIGGGELDIVFVMGWISHLEYFWKHHLFASFLERLGSFSRLILFDKRGTGLSDRVPINELPTLEQRMEDVHAVMDAVNSKRAVLIGVSEGGPMCSLFAATYPERTAGLVMIGTYAKRIRDEEYPWAPSPEQRAAFIDIVKSDWGKPVGIEERAPSMAADKEFREWWATYLRMGASPGAAVALTTMNAEIDVRNVLPLVRVPTLVIHRTGDVCLKVEEGRYVASRIPGSRYVEFPGDDHLPFVGNQDEILDEIERFVSGIHGAEEFDRVLATVMTVRLDGGDDSQESLPNSLVSIRRQLEFAKGREVASHNGSVVAAFDGPARAIRCASSIARSISAGIDWRIGIHTGECDRAGDVYSGFAVDLSERIAGKADPNEILVSRTVKDLVAGSGITFEENSVESFEGLDGEWRLFSVR